MCFSPEASFIAAGVLSALGGYSLRQAYLRLPAYWGFALIPLGFGVQQFAEGLVWLGLLRDNASLTRTGSAVFLCFAFAVWPTWFPVAALLAEREPRRRWALVVLALLSTGWFWFAFLPLLTGAPEHFDACIAGHSIHYHHGDESALARAVRLPATLAYVACVGGAVLLLSRWRELLPVIVLGLLSVVVSQLLYAHAYTSVWCFFAAALSAYTAYFLATATAGASAQVVRP